MGAPIAKLLLQLSCPSCSRYLSSSCTSAHDPPSPCLSCRKLSASCRPPFHRLPPSCSCHSLQHEAHLPAQQDSCASCSSTILGIAANSGEQAASACSRHSPELAPYFLYRSRSNDHPLITIASSCHTSATKTLICKTVAAGPVPPPAPSRSFDYNQSQEQKSRAAEMRWWNSSISYGKEAEPVHCYTWPPRSYSCTFCHRTFMSAQALGGHMNVHRHERARLRQFSQPSATTAHATPIRTCTALSRAAALPAFYMHGDMPACFNCTSNPIMISSSDAISSSCLQQYGLQASKKVGEERSEKLLKERSDKELPINSLVRTHFINNKSKQEMEMSCVDLELRLGHLASK